MLGRRLRRVGLDRRRALLAFEPIDLVAYALVFCLSRPEVGHDIFQHVQQPLDQLACPFIGNAGQVKVFKHSASGSRRGRGADHDLLCQLSFVVATRQGRGFQPRIFEVIPSNLSSSGWAKIAWRIWSTRKPQQTMARSSSLKSMVKRRQRRQRTNSRNVVGNVTRNRTPVGVHGTEAKPSAPAGARRNVANPGIRVRMGAVLPWS